MVGALTYLENCGYCWNKVAGASVGALIATLLAAGYSSKEMKKILIQTDFEKFMDRDRLQSIPFLGKPLSVLTQNSMYSGNYIENWLNALLNKKGITTFNDLYSKDITLKIIATDITKKCLLILPDDLINYNINPNNFSVAKAVRMSISIPFYFKPVKIQYKSGISYIVDGCISCNYPINIFDEESVPDCPTIGFKFDNAKSSYTSMGRTDPLSYLFDIASTMSHRDNIEFLSEKNKARSIIIPTAGVEGTDFDISREKSLLLFKYGYRSAVEFMETWNFEEYISKFY
jgi:Predicted esterase of the alpha-beta hydrolase superfamily